MKDTYRFYKQEDNRWFIDLPEWLGNHDALEMVSGCDLMLDILAKGKDSIRLELCTAPIDGSGDYTGLLMLINQYPSGGGADYMYFDVTPTSKTQKMQVWLCDVTSWLFDEFPIYIYLKVVS